MKPGTFEIAAVDGLARTGTLHTKSGAFTTPAFMPVGTQGTVKGVTPEALRELGAEIVLTNTYHLHLRPGDELVRDLGGIHQFMGWDGPILSDSGGFQVFSLGSLCKVTESGVRFRSHLDGSEVFFTPEKVIQIQENLGVDIMMVLDECLPHGAPPERARASWEQTLRWAGRSLEARRSKETLAFGIVQGGMHDELRIRACEELSALPFDGFAIGGVSVGEPIPLMRRMTELCAARLPEARPRYLMGVGTPLDLVESIALGIDMFDCVIPTRSARFGRIIVREGHYNLRNQRFRLDPSPLEEGCDCYSCRKFSRAYISHLIHAKEILGVQLASLHNLRFYQRLLQEVRAHIHAGTFQPFAAEFASKWRPAADIDDGS